MQATNIEINYDKQAEKIELIVGIPEEMYFCSISKISAVYVEYIEKNGWHGVKVMCLIQINGQVIN